MTALTKPTRMMARQRSPADDRVAKKYCLRATVNVMRGDKVVGVMATYDAGPTVATRLEQACVRYLDIRHDASMSCAEATLTMHAECPVEISDDVFYAPFDDPDARSELI